MPMQQPRNPRLEMTRLPRPPIQRPRINLRFHQLHCPKAARQFAILAKSSRSMQPVGPAPCRCPSPQVPDEPASARNFPFRMILVLEMVLSDLDGIFPCRALLAKRTRGFLDI